MSEQEFIIELDKNGIQINENQKLLFKKYAQFLLEYNKKVNLTAIKTLDDIYLKHFYDSILLLKFIKLKSGTLLDIGSGAGFPGIPLKIINPEINLTLLDSNGKKTTFLKQLSSVLNLDYLVINDRAEDYVKKCRESFDYVVSRAVTQMPILAELSIPYLKVNGIFISYKGKIDDSLENGKYAIEKLGGVVQNVYYSNLPKTTDQRSFVVVSKQCKTDIIFPRNFDKIIKKPLQKI